MADQAAPPYPGTGYPVPSYPGDYTSAPAGSVVVTQPNSKAWFPGYDAHVEENKNRQCLNFALFFLVVFLALAAIFVGIVVMRPGVDFLRFELGECSVKKLIFKEYKSCDCGGDSEGNGRDNGGDNGCRSSFPCYQFRGEFTSDAFDTGPTYMSLSISWWDQGCVWRSCQSSRRSNEENIYNDAIKFYNEHGYSSSKLAAEMSSPVEGALIDTLDDTIKLECYGDNEGSAIMKYINSSVWIGCGTIPIILFVIAVVVFLKCATPGMKLFVSRCIFFPCFIIKDSETTIKYLHGPCNQGHT